jgi:DNA-directed RNA polymerase alpha subunit
MSKHAEQFDAIMDAMRELDPAEANKHGELRVQGYVKFWRNPVTGKMTSAPERITLDIFPPSPQRNAYRASEDFALLSVRARNVLRNVGIETVAELSEWTVKDLNKLRYCGAKTVDELESLVQLHGMELHERRGLTHTYHRRPKHGGHRRSA